MRAILMIAFFCCVSVFCDEIKIKGQTVQAWSHYIKHGYFKDRIRTLDNIYYWGGKKAKHIEPALVEALSDQDSSIRYHAAKALENLASDVQITFPALLEALHDQYRDKSAAKTAAKALKKFKKELLKIHPQIWQIIKKTNREEVLEFIGDPKVIPFFKDILENAKSTLVDKKRAIHVLGLCGSQSVSVLVKHLDDQKLYKDLVYAFEKIASAKSIKPLFNATWKHKQDFFSLEQLCSKIGPKSVLDLLLEIEQYSPKKYIAALECIKSARKSPQAVSILIKSLKHKDMSVCYKALDLLNYWKAKSATKTVVELLQSSDSRLVNKAIETLRTFNVKKEIDKVFALIKSSINTNIHRQVIVTVGYFKAKKYEADLQKFLGGHSHLETVIALSQIDRKKYQGQYNKLVQEAKNPNALLYLFEQIARLDRNLAPYSQLVELLGHPYTHIRRHAGLYLRDSVSDSILLKGIESANAKMACNCLLLLHYRKVYPKNTISILLKHKHEFLIPRILSAKKLPSHIVDEIIELCKTRPSFIKDIKAYFKKEDVKTKLQKIVPIFASYINNSKYAYKILWAIKKWQAKEAIPLLIKVLQNKNSKIHQSILETLQVLEAKDILSSKGIVAIIEKFVRAENPKVRNAAIKLLAKINPGHSSNLNALQDPAHFIRIEAIKRLTNSISKDIVKLLGQALQDKVTIVRIKAIQALAKHPGKESAKLLISALNDYAEAPGFFMFTDRISPCVEAMKVLANMKEELVREAIPQALNILTNGKKHYMRQQAALFLSKQVLIDKKAVSMLITALSDGTMTRPHAALALARMGNLAVPELILALKSKARNRAYGAAMALGTMKTDNKEAIMGLAQLLNTEVAWKAIQALKNIGAPAKIALPEIIACLKNKDWQMRYYAIEILRNLQVKDSLKQLKQMAGDKHWRVAYAATRALQELQK